MRAEAYHGTKPLELPPAVIDGKRSIGNTPPSVELPHRSARPLRFLFTVGCRLCPAREIQGKDTVLYESPLTAPRKLLPS